MTDKIPTPFEQFVDSFEKLIRAVVLEEMATRGVISAKPDEYTAAVETARKEIIANLTAQDAEAAKE
jgi:hypothetical protein